MATLGAVARAAINAVWYQKWIVHLRHRPESGGGIVELIKTGKGNTIEAKVDPIVLNSMALQQSQRSTAAISSPRLSRKDRPPIRPIRPGTAPSPAPASPC